MFREIVPNTLPPVIAMIALLASAGILTEASLSFLGVGDPERGEPGPDADQRARVRDHRVVGPRVSGRGDLRPGLILNVLGDGLNVALSPRLRSHLG